MKQGHHLDCANGPARLASFAAKCYVCLAFVIAFLLAANVSSFAQSPEKLRFRMATVPVSWHAALFLSKERGWLSNLEIEDGTGSVAALNMLAANQADIAESALAAMIIARSRGLPFKAIAGWVPGTDLAIAVNRNSSIKTPKDLEGKRIAYTAGSLEGPFIAPFLKSNEVDLSRVQLVNMEFAARFSAFLSGNVDALVTVAPYALTILERSDRPARVILFQDYGFHLLSVGYVVREETLKKHKPALKELVTIIQRAWTEILSNPAVFDEAIEAIAKHRPNAKIDRARVKEELRLFRPFLQTANTEGKQLGWIARADIAATLDTMKNANVLPAPGDPAQYFTNELFDN